MHYTFTQCLHKLWTCEMTFDSLLWTKHYSRWLIRLQKIILQTNFKHYLLFKGTNIKIQQRGRKHGLHGKHKQKLKLEPNPGIIPAHYIMTKTTKIAWIKNWTIGQFSTTYGTKYSWAERLTVMNFGILFQSVGVIYLAHLIGHVSTTCGKNVFGHRRRKCHQ